MAAFCYMIWNDISEMKKDIKMLLAQNNINTTKIENLERTIYNSNKRINFPINLNDKLLFKNEEFYDIKKYLPTNTSY